MQHASAASAYRTAPAAGPRSRAGSRTRNARASVLRDGGNAGVRGPATVRDNGREGSDHGGGRGRERRPGPLRIRTPGMEAEQSPRDDRSSFFGTPSGLLEASYARPLPMYGGTGDQFLRSSFPPPTHSDDPVETGEVTLEEVHARLRDSGRSDATAEQVGPAGRRGREMSRPTASIQQSFGTGEKVWYHAPDGRRHPAIVHAVIHDVNGIKKAVYVVSSAWWPPGTRIEAEEHSLSARGDWAKDMGLSVDLSDPRARGNETLV